MATGRGKGDTRTVGTAGTSTDGAGGEAAATRRGRGSPARTPTKNRRNLQSRETEAVLPVRADSMGMEGWKKGCEGEKKLMLLLVCGGAVQRRED